MIDDPTAVQISAVPRDPKGNSMEYRLNHIWVPNYCDSLKDISELRGFGISEQVAMLLKKTGLLGVPKYSTSPGTANLPTDLNASTKTRSKV